MSFGRLRKAIGLAVVAASLTVAGSASAMTATLGEADLIGRVAISVPVTVTCNAPSPGLLVFSQSVSVVVEQASGKQIARGTAGIGGSFPNLLFACDGTQKTLSVSVLADPAGPPFHGGSAVMRVTATATAGVPFACCPGSYGSPFETQTAVIGPTDVRLR
jgi:hypothetical protein